MRSPIAIAIILFAAVLLPTMDVIAQDESTKIAVEIDDESVQDLTGRNFVYYIKEGIRKSSEMRLSVSNETRIQVKISTMPKFDDDPSISTIFSVIWMFAGPDQLLPSYVNSTLGYCGRDVAQSSANNIVAQTDKLITDLRKLYSKTRK